MAELHILGQLHGVSDFKEQSSLFCRYSLQTGPNWTLICGCSEGQTVSGKPDFKKSVIWAQPLNLHYVTKGIQGWPKLVLQVSCLDSVGRSWIVGYGVCNLPASPGYHRIEVPCWVPTAVTVTDKIRQYFLGGTHQLTQTDIVNLGTDRHKLNTQSKGSVQLDIHIVLRNFIQFGIEYK
ncbi:B9 domain-containing protein 2-like isoform X2 [Epargyreus clarus]|uniref:B9 domain-containing protein 2-like isoform X2 n=1 Tax=Epargyreus clarus TaxID=520877 RepID=UPI003C2B487B